MGKITHISGRGLVDLANAVITRARIVNGNLILHKYDGSDINAGSITSGSVDSSDDRPTIERMARAAGHRLRAISAGNRSVVNPDVTVGEVVAESTASTIPSATRRGSWDWNTSSINHALRILQGRMIQAGGNGFIQTDLSVVTDGPGPVTPTAISIDTGYDGSKIDILPMYSASNVQYHYIYVDGVLVTTITPQQIAAAGVAQGYPFRVSLTFATSRPRRITWEVTGDIARFAGFDTEADHDIYYPSSDLKGPRVIIAGDSFTEGTGSTAGNLDYVPLLGQFMGWKDVWRSGCGGTGYLYAGPRTPLVNRYVNDIIQQNADIVVLPIGMNDLGIYLSDPASVISAAESVWDGIISGLPKAELVIIGPWPESVDGATPGMTALDSALHAAAVSRSLRYISPIVDKWRFPRSVDGVHPNNDGHEYLGWRIAGYLSVPYLEVTT